MEALEATLTKPLKRVVVIDDAYAAADPADIDGDAVSRFRDILLDFPKRLLQVKKEFRRDVLDPSIPQHLDELLQDETIVSRLWALRERQAWSWLVDTLFREYAEDINKKREDLAGLEDFLVSQKWRVIRAPKFDPTTLDVTGCQLIFLDFYLKGEMNSDRSLERAAELAHLIIGARQKGSLKQYPLVVLMSSRPGAVDQQVAFKERTGLRADFFCFVEKSQIIPQIAPKLERMLEGYHGKQSWAHMLDEFWLGAIRAATTLRQNLSKIEPSEIALLHEAELAVEEARLPDYLSWLVSESLASGLLEDAGVRALGARLPNLIGHRAFPGAVPPSSRLAEMHVRSVMRMDITDGLPETKSSPVQLGDLFARLNGDGTPREFLLVVDQSCDLARPNSSQKTAVLCLRCIPQEISDVALAFYRTAYGSIDLVGMTFGEEKRYYLASWDFVNPTTPDLAELSQRRGGVKRLARLKPVAALARQEDLTQRVGRIGQPVAPPSVTAYRAKLILIGKDSFQKELDATKEPWASVILVQGRHMPKPDATDGSAPSKKKPPTTTTLNLTSDFSEWLAGKLDKLHVPDSQASSQANLLKQHLAAGTMQRVGFEVGQNKAASLGQPWKKASLKKPSAAIHCVFDKTIPKDLTDAMIVLLLTPYEQL
ncbi:hypothetical protein [uncultured Propionivibrio sp.]|uniref:hypothetical protein n=1 Tax=uncultured Propionivibrio sp. TaxID=426737 RepID=UPI0029C0FC56|nr:hypothetical protein [uncultured Propionivibrio sp.]